jgi:hypothetical protein
MGMVFETFVWWFGSKDSQNDTFSDSCIQKFPGKLTGVSNVFRLGMIYYAKKNFVPCVEGCTSSLALIE